MISKRDGIFVFVDRAMNDSVEPHHMVTRRVAPLVLRKSRMSSRNCSARSIFVLPFFTLGPSILLT